MSFLFLGGVGEGIELVWHFFSLSVLKVPKLLTIVKNSHIICIVTPIQWIKIIFPVLQMYLKWTIYLSSILIYLHFNYTAYACSVSSRHPRVRLSRCHLRENRWKRSRSPLLTCIVTRLIHRKATYTEQALPLWE